MPNLNLRRRDCWLPLLAAGVPLSARAQDLRLWPADGAVNVNPDTQLMIALPSAPQLGTSGLIRVYDLADNSIIDTLDMSIPGGPDWRRRRPAGSPPDTTKYQERTVGGVEGLHFHPVIVHGRVATIYLHKALQYGRRYRVTVDAPVLGRAIEWSFTTKASPPRKEAARFVVAADGSGDFSTVQGAVDFVPDKPARPVTILIRNGNYEEMVYVRGKSNLTIRGEDRQKVVVGYGNNSAFNPGKPRYAFSLADCTDVQLSTFSINNYYFGQAEALMIRGERITIDRMSLDGSGDALQLRGSVYFKDTSLRGDGDTILSYGAAFFDRCTIRSLGPINWIRNPATNHGHVFKDCTFVGINEPLPWTRTPDGGGQISRSLLARLPDNGGTNYPYAEAILINCRMEGVLPEGWSVQERPAFDWTNVKFWEFNSMDMSGKPLDMSKRHPIVRHLTLPKDAKIVADYSRPEFILKGWKPVVR